MVKFRVIALFALLMLPSAAWAQEFGNSMRYESMPPEDSKADNPWADTTAVPPTPMPMPPIRQVASSIPSLAGQYMGVSGPNRGPYGVLPPTATSSVDISICERFSCPGYTRPSTSRVDPGINPYTGQPYGGGGGGGFGGGGGGGNLTPPDTGDYGGGYIEFEDGTRKYAHPKRLAPGVMFDCNKGYFDLKNPGAGWQSSHP